MCHIFVFLDPNIPKKVRGGKLEVTSRKCRLLGYWADETKGYRLEDAETGKLITSRDVRFIEDEQPTDLMEIQPDGSLIPVVLAPENPPTGLSQEHAMPNEVEPAPDPKPPVPADEPAQPPDPSASVPRAP